MLTIMALLLSSAQTAYIELREPMLPSAVRTTIASQCGGREVLIRMENTQGRIGSRVTEITIGDKALSDRDLGRITAVIGKRDIIGASVVKCGVEENLDEISIVIRLSERAEYSYRVVGVVVSEDGVSINTA